MPTIRKLAPEEITARETSKLSKRQQTANQYDSMLSDFAPGDWAEVQLDEGDNRLTVRNRLQAAAERHGFSLSFRRTSGNLVRFEVVEPNASASVEEPEEEIEEQEPEPAPVAKKRGRKPAAVAA